MPRLDLSPGLSTSTRPGSNLDLVFRYPPCNEASKDKQIPCYSVAYNGSIDAQGVVPDPVSWLPPFDLLLYHQNTSR